MYRSMGLLKRSAALNQIVDGLLADLLVVCVPLKAVLQAQVRLDSCVTALPALRKLIWQGQTLVQPSYRTMGNMGSFPH